jgi:signal transduction histidine kinase/CheY-like chemotaxis protein/HPt (histidine-containing phosphotransfer) domain-containing protein
VKKNRVQIKIGFLMILAVILLTATGYLSYRNLSAIVSSIHIEMNPDPRMKSIRELSLDLERAQNSIRIYSATNDTLDLKPYYRIISGIDAKVSRLQSECMNDTVLLGQTDTISKLIEENIVIWNELLYLNNNRKVVDYLKNLSDRLTADTENIKKTETNILKRVFSRKYKSTLNEQELISDLQVIKEQDSITNIKLKKRESQLAITGSEIKKQFYDIINKIENEISLKIEDKATSADKLARKTYNWLAMFSLAGTLLAIMVMFIIVRYVRKAHAYQVALQNAKDETEKLARTKEMFMANMSHEIRTPVTAISGFTEQLLHENLDENTIHTVKIIKSSSDHLNSIINDILDFSKLQNNKLKLEKIHFSIHKILGDINSLFERQAVRNNTALSFSVNPATPPVLLGDPYRLKQILINLVGNSVKFTKNGKIHIEVKSDKKESPEIELIIGVSDTGIGIEENKLNLIYDDFTQEEMSTTRNYGGTGLGLSIVKKLVELHNGNITTISRKNFGTTITCHLPYFTGDEKLVTPEVNLPLNIPEEIRNLNILIVDDEEYNRLLFKTILSRWNVKFSEASNGAEALEKLKTGKYDLLFMDARMPGIDGMETTRIIRNELKISDSEMPVICISAAAVREDREKYRIAGMNAFLSKPFTEEMLLTTILSVIKDYLQIITNDSANHINIKPFANIKFDLRNLYHITDGDEQFVKQMLVTFIDTTAQGLNDMRRAAESGEPDQIAELAHKMSAPCRHIGASELFNILKKIEESIMNKMELSSVDTIIREALAEFETLRDLLNEQVRKIQ